MIQYSILLTDGREIVFENSTDDIQLLAETIFSKKTYKIQNIVVNVRHIVTIRRN